MIRMLGIFIVAVSVLVCNEAFAGPGANAQQFQQKAINQSVKKQYEKQYTTTSQQRPPIKTTSKGIVSMPAETKGQAVRAVNTGSTSTTATTTTTTPSSSAGTK